MRVLPVLLYRDTKHAAGGLAVDITTIVEHVHAPLFPGEKAEHTRLDGGEVRHREFESLRGDERCSHQLGQHLRHGIIQQRESVIVALAHQLPRLLQIGHLVPVGFCSWTIRPENLPVRLAP